MVAAVIAAAMVIASAGVGAAVEVPVSDGFDYPLGTPDGVGYGVEGYGGLAFLEEHDYQSDGYPEYHPGEDWNDDDTGRDWDGDSNDAGDPVYAISNGIVRHAQYQSAGWGYLVLIEHKPLPGQKFVLPDSTELTAVWSQYGHLASIDPNVQENQPVRRGQQIGTVGDYPHGSGGAYHLHFEVRIQYRDPWAFVHNTWSDETDYQPWPESRVKEYYTDPSDFINQYRPQITPLIGDWDNNNIDDTGTFNPRTSTFSWVTSPMGEPGDLPIVGDWNGDGIDTIGVYRPRTAEFFLDDDNDGPLPPSTLNFGEIGDFPIVGDWNNDGKDDIGVFRRNDPEHEDNAVFYLMDGDETITIVYGRNDDIPIVGKPDNDGLTKIGVYRPSTPEFIFNHDPLVRTIEFSGYEWMVKSSNTPVGPGPNYFSGSEENVWVDEQGQLHLKIVERDGKWYCAEVYTTESLGYGEYIFYVASRVDQLDKNVVAGLFTWDDAPEYNHREIDIEFSRWGDENNDNSLYTVQSGVLPNPPENFIDFNLELNGDYSTHNFAWQSNRVSFQSIHGHYDSPPDPSYVIESWDYYGGDNPIPGNEKVHINLWLYDTNGDDIGDPPSNGQEAEIIIKSFEYVPVGGRSGGPDDFGYTFTDSNTPEGPTYDWIEISGTGTEVLPNSDDSWVEDIGLGFFFNYYGTDYSQLAISNNGLLFSGGTTWEYVNEPITQSPSVHGFIAPFWDDIITYDSRGAGTIYYQTLGTAPNRMFVVEWYDNKHYWNSDSGVTFEAILYEGSNNILFQYKDVDFGNVYSAVSGDNPPYDNGGSATVGIEGPAGDDGLQYSFNEQVIDPGLAILFKFPQFAGTNLYLSKQAPASKDRGSTMTYTLHYHNFGDTQAQNVVLEDTLPAEVEFVSASDGGSYNSGTGKVTWNIGSVVPNGHGYRTVSVRISQSVQIGNVIQNDASISTSNLEVRYDDNEAHVQTTVTGSSLPPDVGVEPNNGGTGTPSIYWHTPITFSYHSCDTATGVDIRIQINDGGPDITGSMAGGPPDWTYTTIFYPRHGRATITYTVHGCDVETVTFDIYIDPAGYIYDADTGERIEGATVWLQWSDGEGGWENVPTGETPPISQPDENPLITGEDGWYQWDVLEGSYRVHVEASGYYPADSIVVSIPPPVTDLHVGLTRLPDTTPPAITNVDAASDSNSAEITWDTDEVSDSLVRYGTSSGSHPFSESDSEMVLSHSITLTGLTPDTLYYYVVSSADAQDNSAESPEFTFRTLALSDTEQPVIESVTLYPANTTAGSTIDISVSASDNVGVDEVTADGTPLTNSDELWQGSITAPSTVGSYSVTIRAEDAAENFVETTVDYSVVEPTGSLGVGIAPKVTTASTSGTTIDYTVKIKSMQNFDDTVHVYVSMDGLPASYQMPMEWFDWNEQDVRVAANSEISLPLQLIMPAGEPAGRKAFRVKANSNIWITTAYDTGVISIS